MTERILTPQSVELHYVLPAIRRELALDLKELGLGQKDIARKLGVTAAAISQYVNEKRACKVDFNDHVKEEIKRSAMRLKEDAFLIGETQILLRLIKAEKITCRLCKKEGHIPKDCEVCFKCGYI